AGAERARDAEPPSLARLLGDVPHEDDEARLEGPVALADVEADDGDGAPGGRGVDDDGALARADELLVLADGLEDRRLGDEQIVEVEEAQPRIAGGPGGDRGPLLGLADVDAEAGALLGVHDEEREAVGARL